MKRETTLRLVAMAHEGETAAEMRDLARADEKAEFSRLARLETIAQECQAYNNTVAWVDERNHCVWVDSLKGSRPFASVAAAYNANFRVVYRATEAEERAAWSGEGQTHGREFGGRKCLCYVFCLTVA